MTLVECLNDETVEILKERLAALPYLGKKISRKTEIVALIDKLLQLEYLKKYFSILTDIEKKAIAEVVYGPEDVFSEKKFFAKYNECPKLFKKTARSSMSYYEKTTPTLLGAFFFKNYMPTDLQERFKTFIAKPKKLTLSGINNLPEDEGLVVKNMEITAMGEIKAILQLINNKKLKVSDKTRYPSAAAIQAVEEILYAKDYYTEDNKNRTGKYDQEIGSIRAFGWLMLIQAGKLANLSGGTLRLTPAGRKALQASPEQTLKELWDCWLETKILDEFRRIDVIKGQTGRGKRNFTNPEIRRDAIFVMLTETSPDIWIRFTDFSNHMLGHHITFDIVHGDPWFLYICDQQYGSLGYSGCHGWNILQERYMRCFLFEYAATLGLIDIAYVSPVKAKRDYNNMWGTDELSFLSRYDGLRYIRLNNLGAYCLGLIENHVPQRQHQDQAEIKINDKGEISVLATTITPDVFILLDQFAKRNSNSTWTLSQDSMLSAIEVGNKLSTLLEFFIKHNTIIPEHIKKLIETLEQNSCLIQKKGQVVLYECTTPEVANYFAREPRSNKYCSLVGERLLAVTEEKLTKFQSELRKLGYVVFK